MNSPKPPLATDVRLAAEIRQRFLNAGVDENDPDFAELFDSECGLRERLTRMARAALWREAQAAALTEIIRKNQERQRRHKAAADGIRAAILWALQESGLPAIEAPDLTISVDKGRAGLVGDGDASALPDHLRRTKHEPDKAAIKAALEAGEEVPGYSLATNGAPTLKIRNA